MRLSHAKHLVTWALVALPTFAGLVVLGRFCRDVYLEGLNFVPGLHGLQFLVLTAAVVGVALLGLAVALAAIFGDRKHLVERQLYGWALLLAFSGLLAPVAALPAIGAAYRRGREQAYAGLDLPAIYAACQSVRAQLAPGTPSRLIEQTDSAYAALPAAILAIHPDFVWIHPSITVLQLDGGGPATHEGIAVAWDQRLCLLLDRKQDVYRLDDTLPVYRYALYDFGMLIQGLDEGDLAHQLAPAGLTTAPAQPTEVAR